MISFCLPTVKERKDSPYINSVFKTVKLIQIVPTMAITLKNESELVPGVNRLRAQA